MGEFCRACLHKLININVNFTLYKCIYTELTSIQITDEDSLPKVLCINCASLLNQFKEFKEICVRSNEYLSNPLKVEPMCETTSLLPMEEVKIETILSADEILFETVNQPVTNEKYQGKKKHKKSKRKYSDESSEESSLRRTRKYVSTRDSSTDDDDDEDIDSDTEDTETTHICLEEDCNKKFQTSAALKIHRMRVHNKDKSSKNQDNLKRPHRCNIKDCRKSYRNAASLEAHITTHNGSGSVVCDICEKPLSSIRNMLRHKRTHRSVEERSFKCTLCYKIMVNEFSLKNHMRSHENFKSHVCDECGLAFVAKSSLNKHKQSHNTDKPYPCKICSKTFKSSGAVYNHVKRDHEKESSVACSICEKMFPSKKCLYSHCKITHTAYTTTENVYACRQCDIKCKNKTILRKHEKLHTGERKYACPLCPKTFAHSTILKKHSYFHSGERPVHCEICNKGFYQKCALDIHMNVHKRQWIAEGVPGIKLTELNRGKKKNTYQPPPDYQPPIMLLPSDTLDMNNFSYS